MFFMRNFFKVILWAFLSMTFCACSNDDDVVVAIPTIEGDVEFEDSLLVTIKAEEGSIVYYTLNGTVPTTSTQTNGVAPHSFYLKRSATVSAIAARDGGVSEVATKDFTKLVSVEVPEITGNTYFSGRTVVTIKCNEHLPIYYTTDGSEPTAATKTWGWEKVSFTIDKTTTVKAIAILKDRASKIAEKTFTKNLYGDVSFCYGDSVRLEDPEKGWKTSDPYVAMIDGDWLIAGLVGSATISCDDYSFMATVSPRYTTYKTPCIEWGASLQYVKNYMSDNLRGYEAIESTGSELLYVAKTDAKAFGYVYIFEGVKLDVSGVYVYAKYEEELVSYLLERYFYVGHDEESGVLIFVNKEENMLIGLYAVQVDGGYALVVEYHEYKETSATRAPQGLIKNKINCKFGKGYDQMHTNQLRILLDTNK